MCRLVRVNSLTPYEEIEAEIKRKKNRREKLITMTPKSHAALEKPTVEQLVQTIRIVV